MNYDGNVIASNILAKILSKKNLKNSTECCVKSDNESTNNISKSFTDSNEKFTSFICEYGISEEETETLDLVTYVDVANSHENYDIDHPQKHCNDCLVDHAWNNSVCQQLDPLVTCRCSDKKH